MTTVRDYGLAGGDLSRGSFLPNQVLIEGPFDTDGFTVDAPAAAPDVMGDAATTFTYPKYSIMGLNSAGHLVPWNVAGIDGVQAQGRLIIDGTNPAANDTITINGQTITFVASGASGAQINIGADAGATAATLIAKINATAAMAVTAGSFVVPNADDAPHVGYIPLTANATGDSGDNITLAKSSAHIAVSAAHLEGGQGAPEGTIYGILAQSLTVEMGEGGPCPAFVTGRFQFDQLQIVNPVTGVTMSGSDFWGDGISGLTPARVSFVGSRLNVGNLMWSDKGAVSDHF